MTGGMLEGAALGTLFQEGARPVTGLVSGLVSRAFMFNATRRNLGSTVGRNIPAVQDMTRFDEGDQETSRLLEDLQEAEKVVNKHSNVRWWKCCCLPRYQGELQEAFEAVARCLTLDLQSVIARDTRETLSLVRNIRGKQFEGLFKAPATPDLTVGLDVPFNKLKRQLLQSGASPSVIVLTGLAGSGKTTLASLLCWDQQIRDKFGENILFITVSKSPSLKTIVQTLFRHYEYDVPDLGGERTVRQLENLLKEIGQKSPMMLVLDDVWDGSESLIHAFMVKDLSNYKVLVTSRVNFPRFEYSCRLEPLCPEDSVNLFRHFALPNDGRSPAPMIDEELIQKAARSCWGLPLAIELIGGSLCGQPIVAWKRIEMELSKGGSILHSGDDLLNRLQKCYDVLEDKPIIKDCFMDLGLFPEDHKIPVAALIDIWIELYQVNDDICAIYVHDLANRHLAKLVDRRNRKAAMDTDMCYNKHFLKLHDLLRDLAIRECNQEPIENRKRLMIELSGNNRPEWREGQNQQGIVSRMLSFFPKRWIPKDQKQVVARTLSISTDETFTSSDWCYMRPNEAQVLVLNIRSSRYSLPEFTEIMSKLKVLIVSNYGFHPAELNNFELLGSLPDLKRIRLDNLSVPRLCKLRNLQKLSLYMCNTRQAFETSSIQISDALPNLEEMNIAYCNDLLELPSDLCNITTMKKLSITSCHKLATLPQEIGKLQNLQLLRLSSCSELLEIPESVGRLQMLSCLDVSDCVSLIQLPEHIGDLLSLKNLYMWGCSRLSELRHLPSSVKNFQHLQHVLYVTCDEEVAALWEEFTGFPNLRIATFKADISLDWLPGVNS